jgi:hypothetical protein
MTTYSILRKASSSLDIKTQDYSKVKYYLLRNDVIVAEIDIINGVCVKAKQIQNIIIKHDKINLEWYKKIISPFMPSNTYNKYKNRYNCIDIHKNISIGTITFDPEYQSFVSSVKPPYSWVSSDKYPEFMLDIYDDLVDEKDFSDVLPSFSLDNCHLIEYDIMHSR